MASEVTVRKLTQGFMVSTPRTMRDGVPVEEAFAEANRPAMIQRVLKCLGIEPSEAYFEAAHGRLGGTVITTDPPTVEPYLAGFEPNEDGVIVPGCANGLCGVD
jgi:hypothetical protein